jgi:hypothetical protein
MSGLPQTADIFGPGRHFAFVPKTDMDFASLDRAFQADGRGFSPFEGRLEGGGSVSWKRCDQVVDKGSR